MLAIILNILPVFALLLFTVFCIGFHLKMIRESFRTGQDISISGLLVGLCAAYLFDVWAVFYSTKEVHYTILILILGLYFALYLTNLFMLSKIPKEGS